MAKSRVNKLESGKPVDWTSAAAPSLDEFEVMARASFATLPQTFRDMCGDVLIRIEDF